MQNISTNIDTRKSIYSSQLRSEYIKNLALGQIYILFDTNIFIAGISISVMLSRFLIHFFFKVKRLFYVFFEEN